MKKRVLTILLAASLLLTTQGIADNVTDPIKTALKAYKDKEYKVAIEELKYATAALQKLEAEENKKLLPDPLDGWEKREGDSRGQQMAMGMLGGGTMTTAVYTRRNERIEIQIIANSPMLATIGMMINNPMFAGSDGNEPYRYKRIKGIKKKQGSKSEITLLLAGQIMIKLEGNNLKEDDILEEYLDEMDMRKIKAALLP